MSTPRMVDPGHPDCNDDESADFARGDACPKCGDVELDCSCPAGECRACGAPVWDPDDYCDRCAVTRTREMMYAPGDGPDV